MGRRIGTFGLVNYKDHPTDRNYAVFNFNKIAEAKQFEEILNEKNVWFEKDEDEVDGKPMYLFAVKMIDFNIAQRANFTVTGAHKDPLIKNKLLRYTLLIFVFALIGFAIVGYIKNKDLYKPEKIETQGN